MKIGIDIKDFNSASTQLHKIMKNEFKICLQFKFNLSAPKARFTSVSTG